MIRNNSVSNNLPNVLQYLDFEKTYFYSFKSKSRFNLNNHSDNFKINHPYNRFFINCLRFNAVTNKSVELFKASSIEDRLQIYFNNFYRENIYNIEYYNYTLSSRYFLVYAGDNALDSFENLKYLQIDTVSYYRFDIEKVSTETKLPEPYNQCKKSSVYEPFHQMNCIEACFFKEIKNKYNCTLHSTLFSIQGFKQCERNYELLIEEFSASCKTKCPLENCFSEKFILTHNL